jgi:putative membrane protein insertion efficiency factor
MSALRQRLRSPWPCLLLAALAYGAAFGDAYVRSPRDQWTAKAYVVLVHAYQSHASPLTSACVRCRFQPSCSRYSEAAVRRHGLLAGLELTAKRLWRCRGSVPLGTPDPVP